MNCIFVVNTNNVLNGASLASITAAALRWDALLWICRELDSPLHPSCWKTFAWQLVPPDVDRMLVLDADTVVNSQCPSPFVVFDPSKIVVVSDRPPHPSERDGTELDEWKTVTGNPDKPSRYFNSGFILSSRSHSCFFDQARILCGTFPDLFWHDQTPFNYSACALADQVEFTSDTWNFQNPAGRVGDWQNMKENIYHFPGNSQREKQMAEVVWN